MSTAIDNFTNQLHDNLEAVEDRAKSFKHNIKSAIKKDRVEIQSKLDEAKASIAAKKQEFDDYRAKLKTQFEEKEAEVQSSVDEWKASREVKKLEHRAEKAEDYAVTSVYLAMAMMEEAEAATLTAICDRMDAEAAHGNSKKHS
jgi:predicted  nucleic acid-binding Zn-ribbon protein